MWLLRYGSNCLLIDCGMQFPDEEMYGVDKVIPDFSYLEKFRNQLSRMLLTHGHEDHIGALPNFLR